jgi:cytochrome bd ubiquinol oxidase subunit II
LVELWFALLCFMLTMFVVLDGWDIGAGALHFLVAKNDPERRQVIAAIGPLWSWHEVWLVAAGGTFVLAFPELMAVSFSGFYLALWMVLWSFVLRGISIEVGGHINDSVWRSGWDFVFAASNVLLAIPFGTALGNVIRGVPIDGSGISACRCSPTSLREAASASSIGTRCPWRCLPPCFSPRTAPRISV